MKVKNQKGLGLYIRICSCSTIKMKLQEFILYKNILGKKSTFATKTWEYTLHSVCVIERKVTLNYFSMYQ